MLGPFGDATRRKDAAGTRRVFADEAMDLFVWYSEDGAIDGFQLCYDKPDDVHAFTWLRKGGLSHSAVDLGDASPLKNQAPILVADGTVPLARVVKDFTERSKELDAALRKLVLRQLTFSGKPAL